MELFPKYSRSALELEALDFNDASNEWWFPAN